MSKEDCTICFTNEYDIHCESCSIKCCNECFEYFCSHEEPKSLNLICIAKCGYIHSILDLNLSSKFNDDYYIRQDNEIFNANMNVMDETSRHCQQIKQIYNNIFELPKIRNSIFKTIDVGNIVFCPKRLCYGQIIGNSCDSCKMLICSTCNQELLEIHECFLSMKCIKEYCYGMIINNICDLCNLCICPICKEEKHKDHQCNQDTLNSINSIEKECKPCSQCNVPCYKESGCNDMHCTNCGCLFNYRTGVIYSKNAKNSHHYHIVNGKLVNKAMKVTPDATATTGVPVISNNEYLSSVANAPEIIKKTMHYLVHHSIISTYNDRFNIRGNTVSRIKYIYKMIDDNQFRSEVNKSAIVKSNTSLYKLFLFTMKAIYDLDIESPMLTMYYNEIVDHFNHKFTSIKKRFRLSNLCNYLTPINTELLELEYEELKISATLKPKQIEAIKKICSQRAIMLELNTGYGKSLVCVYSMWLFHLQYPQMKIFILCPKSTYENIELTSIKYFGKPLPPGVICTNYNSIITIDIEYKDILNCMVICDEIHDLRTDITDLSGAISERIINICSTASRVMLVSATPIVNSVKDLLNPYLMAKGYTYYMHKRNDDNELMSFCSSIAIRNREILSDGYPLVTMYKQPFILSGHILDKYNEVEHDNWYHQRTHIANTNKDKLVFIGNLLKTNKQICIYSELVTGGTMVIKAYLDTLEISYRCLDGRTSGKQRQKFINDFNQFKVQVIVLSKVGSTGIDLPYADIMIMFDIPFTPSIFDQSIARVIRYNPDRKDARVDVYILFDLIPEDVEYFRKDEFNESNHGAAYSKYQIIHKKRIIVDKYRSML